MDEFWGFVRWGSVMVATPVVATLGYRAARVVFDDVYARVLTWRRDRLTLAHVAAQNKLREVRTIEANDRGRFPLLVGTDGAIRDPNTLRAFTLHAVRETYPWLESVEPRVRALEAAQGWPTRQAAEAMLPEIAPEVVWPSTVDLVDLFRDRQPSIYDLVVGVRPGPNGLERVSESLHNLMHVLSIGASGWGKSSWLRSFLWQIAKAREPVEVVAIDINGSEFNALREWGKLRYPLARRPADAAAVLGAVIDEIRGRAKLYEQHPLVTKLDEYNVATGQDLPPWVVVVDEGTNLLHQAGIGGPLRELVQTARQYGVYVLLAGQTAKATVIDTEIRDQFSTRLCFHTSPPSSRVVLDDKAAAEIHEKGRAIVQMVGHEQGEVQGAWVTREAFMAALSGGGARMAMPESGPPQSPTVRNTGQGGSKAAEVWGLHEQGESDTAIARQVFGHGNTFYIEKVRAILQQQQDAPAKSDVDAV